MNKKNLRPMSIGGGPARLTYGGPVNFCAIFEQDMDALYSLAFLLTGDDKTAEQCFLSALDDCRRARNVFPGWARSWSRRAVIKQAIGHLQPSVDEAARGAQYAGGFEATEEIPRLLLRLPSFQRFVFVMTVLERYSARECAALLDCSAREVERARINALQFLGQQATRMRPAANFAGSGRPEPAATANMGGSF